MLYMALVRFQQAFVFRMTYGIPFNHIICICFIS